MSSPFPGGYRRIRDRAHAMTTHGHAGLVLAHLLGYLNQSRRTPPTRKPQLGTADSQYLHCVGHSFGGRLLGQAIMAAASPYGPPRLSWPWKNPDYPFTVDTFLVFQMAAQPTIFTEELVSPKVAQTLAREVGVSTAVLNPLEGLTKQELSAGQDYVSVMRSNLHTLEKALGCPASSARPLRPVDRAHASA
jgi:hypothetical protein